MGYIYKISNNINNKLYIGYTTTKITTRMRKHRNDDFSHGTILGRAIHKYGWENFSYEIVIEENDKEKLLELEIYYIKYFNSKKPNGYNMTDGGEKMYGENNPFYNKKHTSKTKKRLSQISSQKTQEKNPFYGKKHTNATKNKIGIANSKPVCAILDDRSIKTFNSATEAGSWCIENNITNGKTPNSDISKRCFDGKKAFGYYWRYLEEDVETMVNTSRADDGLLLEVQNKE